MTPDLGMEREMGKSSSGISYPGRFFTAASSVGLGESATGSISRFKNDVALMLYGLYQQVSYWRYLFRLWTVFFWGVYLRNWLVDCLDFEIWNGMREVYVAWLSPFWSGSGWIWLGVGIWNEGGRLVFLLFFLILGFGMFDWICSTLCRLLLDLAMLRSLEFGTLWNLESGPGFDFHFSS